VDTFKKADGTLIDGEFFTHLLYFREGVRKFQVIQKDYKEILFKIVKTSSELSIEDRQEIILKTRILMGNDCTVTFEFVDQIPPTSSGKYRYTISEVLPL
jgi:phenylacetate-CoA ligase